ncbi:uncharacterized protein PITG_10345 [Phytophthora infestans T30-4]|uniref:VPS9 domain-containing protein n=1 Tax=Phytophthora infestans (strain T30-4) TaxID=403677 RepID=D0NF41_PHYIT|nr:uncharacterized protein PITG_10345 [Phytophthora infestans T30-4]EEY56830.1 conserved hypothetical protein [Phytophthora infestans T30-4]|eukprot:XP_002902158.1 conserved hypothetical protein [Phytophthora infestans T30-4]
MEAESEVEQLRRANEQLRSEVADLTSALLARDLELVRLRDRCQFLTTAVEQQDEVIAKIYASTAAATANKESMVTALPSPSTVGSILGSGLVTGKLKYNSKQTEKRTLLSSMKSYPGAVGLADPLDEPQFDSKQQMSLEVEKLGKDAVKIDLDQLPYTPRGPVSSHNHSATASVYSSSSTATASSSSSLFGDTGEPVSKPPRSWSSPIVKRRPSLERQDSSPTEEVFARSAGFLRKSNRTMSGRLSVSDLGLLHNDDDIDSNQTEEAASLTAPTQVKDEGNSLGLGDNGASGLSTKSRNLFAGVDEALKAKKKASSDPTDGEEDSLTYGEFLQRISLPASRDVLDKIRMFVGSILGPRGDGRPPRSTDYVGQLKECQQWVKEDEALLRRMQLLSFITPEMLDIKPCMRNEVVWSMAEDELRRINSFRSPGDKINCIVRCCSVIFSVLNLSRGDSGSRPGADDFLPVFIYIVLHSQIPRLHSNCEYIAAYRNQADLMSKAGYCFVNLRSAVEFIMAMDGSMLSISDDEFKREREKSLLKA